MRVDFCDAVYEKANNAFNKYLADHGYPASTHAGIPDTSEMLYLGGDGGWVRKELVATAMGDPVRKPDEKRDPSAKRVANGISGDARRSTAELVSASSIPKLTLRRNISANWAVKPGSRNIHKLRSMALDELLLDPSLTLSRESAPNRSENLAIYYEHPAWFDRLFAELDRRGAAYTKLFAPQHFYDPEQTTPDFRVLFNRMSPSADRRDHGSAILYTLSYLGQLELSGIRVINGSQAFRYEISKALQLSLLRSLRLPYPKSRVIHDGRLAAEAAEGLRFPVVVKPNVGGSGAGVVRFNTPEDLQSAAQDGKVELGFDHVGLVQEFIPARGGYITRVETLNGKFLYAIQVHLTGDTFDLCPADICQTTRGESLNNACVVEAAKAGLRVEGYQPPKQVIEAVEKTVKAAKIDVGGIEYIVDDRDGQLYYYDVNALSNFVADATRVIGFDPFKNLVNFLLDETAHA